MAKKKTTDKKRRPGRPKKGEEIIRPEHYDDIVDKYYSGWTFEAIAQHYGVHKGTIEQKWKRTIQPRQAAAIPDTSLGRWFAELESIKREAWKRFHSEAPAETQEQVKEKLGGKEGTLTEKLMQHKFRPGQVAWMDVITKVVEMQMKASGVFVERHAIELDAQFRLAGMAEDELAEEMASEIEHNLQLVQHEEAV